MRADYVIVGSGSAGSALAYRLSESGTHSVLVIEAGGSDIGPFIQMPASLAYPMNMSRYDWGYVSEPEPHMHNRQLAAPRGKVVGGSSSINGMVYVRGHSKDYDYWQSVGAKGWGYEDVRPYFDRMETWHSGGHGGDQSWRGTSGPLHVTRGTLSNPLHAAFIQAGSQAGYPQTGDYNGQYQEGFGPFDMTVWQGRRWSTANAYLHPARKRHNCKVVYAQAQRVIMQGTRATGVEVRMHGKVRVISANAEVILCASAFNSPQLLMLSGIGPADHLRDKGIQVTLDLPGVGQNLQDHLEVYFQQECLLPITLYKYWNIWGKAMVGARWLCTKGGLGASNQFESGAFIRSGNHVDYPDVQFHFLPIAVRYDGKTVASGHGYQVHVGTMRSASRGSVSLRSANPQDPPKIVFNYMSHEQDWIDFRAAIRIARKVLQQPAFVPFAGKEIQPGEAQTSDEALDEFVREHAESAYHPCGTARMGALDDAMAVVDSHCRVIGAQNLRVVDCSIFPRLTYGNLNAPSIMVGEKAADHICKNHEVGI